MSVHLKQAEENERLLNILIKDHPKDFFDWKINVCFYITLHYVNAYINKYDPKIIIKSHPDTLDFLNRKGKPIIYKYYKALYKLSLDSRYNGFADLKEFNDNNKTDFENTALPILESIKDYCVKFIEKK